MTGQQASTGRQIDAAIKLWVAQNGNKAGGKKVEVIVKDDGGVPDTDAPPGAGAGGQRQGRWRWPASASRRSAMATAPIATQSKTPMVVMAAATSASPRPRPFVVRTSFTLPQARWAWPSGPTRTASRRSVTLVADYGPGFDAEKYFADRVTLNGGAGAGEAAHAAAQPRLRAVLQKVRDAKPDALFVFLPSGQGAPS
jgi:branched-chain amino acid transport system substrate-binding protein